MQIGWSQWGDSFSAVGRELWPQATQQGYVISAQLLVTRITSLCPTFPFLSLDAKNTTQPAFLLLLFSLYKGDKPLNCFLFNATTGQNLGFFSITISSTETSKHVDDTNSFFPTWLKVFFFSLLSTFSYFTGHFVGEVS